MTETEGDPLQPYIAIEACGGRLLQSGWPSFAFGADLPHRIGSHSWSWDGARLVAETCRYGVRPLYYACTPDRIVLAPSISTLLRLRVSTELDEAALAVFSRFGSFLGEDTPFRAIRALPPGGKLGWDGTLTLTCGDMAVEPLDMKRSEATARYAALFRDAVARCSGPASLVPLSGGRDSRHIAFEAHRLGHLARCFTLRYSPPKPNEDAVIARQVAAALGVPHEVLTQSGDRLAKERHATLASSFATNDHYWLVPLDRWLRGLTSATSPLLDGIGGDVLSAGLFLDAGRLSLYRAGRLDELAERLLSDGGRTLPFLKDAGRLSFALAHTRMVEELARHAEAPNPVAAFFFWNRTRRSIAPAPFAILKAHRVHCPYLDPELFTFLLGLPPEHFLDHHFHSETILAAFPEHAAIPFETKSRRSVGTVWHLRHYAGRLMQGLVQRPGRLLERRYCLERLAHMLLAGNARFFWLAQIISYFAVLEEALGAGPASAPVRRADTPMLPPIPAARPGSLA